MIYTKLPPDGTFSSSEEFEAYYEKINSYDEYISEGHEWCWSFVGNIIKEHEYGEDKTIKSGTKHFSAGTKIYLAPASWGDGYEMIHVIGLSRGHKYIEVVMRRKYIENYRMQKVYKPAVVKRMINSENTWWGDSNDDRLSIIEYLKDFAPEEAEKQITIMQQESGL